jgi:hypothetical protein
MQSANGVFEHTRLHASPKLVDTSKHFESEDNARLLALLDRHR